MKKDLPRCMRKFLYLLIRPLRVVGVGGGGFCVGVSMKILVDGLGLGGNEVYSRLGGSCPPTMG